MAFYCSANESFFTFDESSADAFEELVTRNEHIRELTLDSRTASFSVISHERILGICVRSRIELRNIDVIGGFPGLEYEKTARTRGEAFDLRNAVHAFSRSPVLGRMPQAVRESTFLYLAGRLVAMLEKEKA